MQLTVGQIRDLIDGLDDSTPVAVFVSDDGNSASTTDIEARVVGTTPTVHFCITVDDLG